MEKENNSSSGQGLIDQMHEEFSVTSLPTVEECLVEVGAVLREIRDELAQIREYTDHLNKDWLANQ